MKERSHGGAPRPLPRDWLPDPQPTEADPSWREQIERIMAAAAPELRTLRSRRSAAQLTWWSEMARWCAPAAALAAAATTFFLLSWRPGAPPESPPGSILLELVATNGDPVALWRARGIEADPVLAWVALQRQEELDRQSAPAAAREENSR